MRRTPGQPAPLVQTGPAAWQARHPTDAVEPGHLQASWWSVFADPVLDQLEQRVATQSPDVQVAYQRVQQSRAVAGIVKAAQAPQLGAQAGYSRQANSANSPLVALGAPTYDYDLWHVGFVASWELDLWGALARRHDASLAQVRVSEFEQQATLLSLQAELAGDYFALRGTQAGLQRARQAVVLQQQLQDLLASRVRHGAVAADVLEAGDAVIATLKARVLELEARAGQLRNGVAVLLGDAPQALDAILADAPLPQPPERLPVSLPSELARHRPDVQAAEARLQAAVAQVGAAQADFYPRVQLSGDVGTLGFHAHELGLWDSREFSVGPTLYLPIFTGGRLTRNLALTEAAQQEAALSYRKVVLHAWAEVDDALDAWSVGRQRIEQLHRAQLALGSSVQRAAQRYAEGAADQQALLQARLALLHADANEEQAVTATQLAAVALCRALGGGWSGHEGGTPALQASEVQP